LTNLEKQKDIWRASMKEIDLQQRQPPPPHNPGEWDQFTRQAAIVILLLGVLVLISVLRPLLNLLAVTGIFILILSYPVNKLKSKTRIAYPAAVFAVFIPIGVLLFFFLGNMFHWFVENTQSMVNQLQENPDIAQSVKTIISQLPGIVSTNQELLSRLAAEIGRQLAFMLQFIYLTATSFFLAFLFILEMPSNLTHSFQSLSDVSQREFGILFDRLSNVWNGWLRSTVITSVIIGFTTALELFLFGIPYAGVIGIVAGFLNLIPTFGPFISYILIIVVTYTQGSSYLALSPVALTLLVFGINLLINQFVRLVIFPKLAGKAVHLPVFLVILGLVVAAVLWGVIGVILVVPLLGTAREVLNYVLRKINRKDPYPGEAPQASLWTRDITSQ
jgi:predicted PurR-regulated permease PerM